MMYQRCRYLFITICALLFGCDAPVVISYDPSDSELVSMASLREQSSSVPREITGDVYIEGRVLSSDDSRNIRGSLYITDLTATVEVRIDEKYIYKLFPCGSKIRVSCNSLHMYLSNGVLCLGLDSEKFWVTSIPSDMIAVYLERTPAPLDILSVEREISELESGTLGYYIEIRDVQFEECALGTNWGSYDEITERVIVDKSGATLAVQTLPTATFAHYELPSGSGRIGGILISDDDEYKLIVTNYHEVKMSGARF